MVLKERMEKGRDRSLDGVTGQLTYFSHSILGNKIRRVALLYILYFSASGAEVARCADKEMIE